MKIKQQQDLLGHLARAEAAARTIVETSGKGLSVLQRVRTLTRETEVRLREYEKAERKAKAAGPAVAPVPATAPVATAPAATAPAKQPKKQPQQAGQ